MGNEGIDVEAAVRTRYTQGALNVESSLCCPVQYEDRYLEAVPAEVLEKDYGCGDPTRWLQEGDTVVDLGCGGGKVCFIASQIVGPGGRVIGVDCNLEMLALARKYQREFADAIGHDNISFHCGLIQDLELDLDLLNESFNDRQLNGTEDWIALRSEEERLRRECTMIPTASVDCVVSNCVLNLVRPGDRRKLFAEIFRVLRKGGRAVISDIVSDEDVPDELRNEPDLWSGCISGAYREDLFLESFEAEGFHGVEIVGRQQDPWQTVQGVEFRSITVRAFKGKQGPCIERNQALVYKGPFKQVIDDDGHLFLRGERMAVCDKTFHLLQQEPYDGMFEAIAPRTEVPLNSAKPFHCEAGRTRSAEETKGAGYSLTLAGEDCGCDPGCC